MCQQQKFYDHPYRPLGGKSDLILKILNRHSRCYRYDAHDTILLNHIHFGSLLVVRRRF